MTELELMQKASVMSGRYAPTPTGRLAELALEALDHDDHDMVRICLKRLLELGGKR